MAIAKALQVPILIRKNDAPHEPTTALKCQVCGATAFYRDGKRKACEFHKSEVFPRKMAD